MIDLLKGIQEEKQDNKRLLMIIAVKLFAMYLISKSDVKGRIHVSDLHDYVSDFIAEHPEKVEHDSLCETETYKSY